VAAPAIDLPLDGISVLAVDDDRSTLEALTLLLESRGARVYPVRSAAAALALREANVSADVIVSDVTMTGSDGLTMMAAIRAAETAAQRAPTPAIAVSGYATQEDQMRARVAGYQVHMAKPIDIAVLLNTIRDLAGRGDKTCEGERSHARRP
jgi:CheY-like chemotaxis protein